jgi:hypothetical protein
VFQLYKFQKQIAKFYMEKRRGFQEAMQNFTIFAAGKEY